MKKLFIILLFVVTGTATFSQPVSENELKTAAWNFYKSYTKNNPEKQNAKISKLIIHTFQGIETYAVAVFDNKDWVALATDKRLKPILAHSVENSWTDTIVPPAKLWFDWYDHYVYEAKVNNRITSSDLDKNYPAVWNRLLTNEQQSSKDVIVQVPPLLTNKWGTAGVVGDPYAYNYYMPPANGCAHAAVCCVALATAQILHYWHAPACSVFDWDNMPDSLVLLNNPNYDWQKKQIANLLINVSVLLPVTSYSCNVSYSYTFYAYRALKDTFGFSEAVYLHRDNHPHYWDSLLCENLYAHWPVLYSGRSESGGGHAFICDGWETLNNTDSLFHFVYGRYGDDDGYYSLNSDTLVYYLHQSAIMNLVPTIQDSCTDSIAVYQDYRNTHSELYFLPRAVTIYSGPEPITIASGETVSYQASDEIVLENFETEVGADFVAEIKKTCVDCSVFFDSTAADSYSKRFAETAMPTTNNHLQVYPNPSTGIYTVSCNTLSENTVIRVYNCFGKRVGERPVKTGKIQLDLFGQPAGIYLIQWISEKNMYQQKIIKL